MSYRLNNFEVIQRIIKVLERVRANSICFKEWFDEAEIHNMIDGPSTITSYLVDTYSATGESEIVKFQTYDELIKIVVKGLKSGGSGTLKIPSDLNSTYLIRRCLTTTEQLSDKLTKKSALRRLLSELLTEILKPIQHFLSWVNNFKKWTKIKLGSGLITMVGIWQAGDFLWEKLIEIWNLWVK